MGPRAFHVLFLCTGNSARSIMAESLLRHWGAGHFVAHSAGSFPKGAVHPLTLELLRRIGLPTENLRSKSWDEFAAADAPPLDFVFTVCGNAARELCPVWPGQPITAHWAVEDPALVEGSEQHRAQAFRRALIEVESRIKLFTSLPLHALDRVRIQSAVHTIGRGQPVA